MAVGEPPRAGDEGVVQSIAIAGYGGMQATILSAVTLVLSGFSLYESSFATADLDAYVPPVIQYARDSGGDVELFAIPITITNGGARTGTILRALTAVDIRGAARLAAHHHPDAGEERGGAGKVTKL